MVSPCKYLRYSPSGKRYDFYKFIYFKIFNLREIASRQSLYIS